MGAEFDPLLGQLRTTDSSASSTPVMPAALLYSYDTSKTIGVDNGYFNPDTTDVASITNFNMGLTDSNGVDQTAFLAYGLHINDIITVVSTTDPTIYGVYRINTEPNQEITTNAVFLYATFLLGQGTLGEPASFIFSFMPAGLTLYDPGAIPGGTTAGSIPYFTDTFGRAVTTNPSFYIDGSNNLNLPQGLIAPGNIGAASYTTTDGYYNTTGQPFLDSGNNIANVNDITLSAQIQVGGGNPGTQDQVLMANPNGGQTVYDWVRQVITVGDANQAAPAPRQNYHFIMNLFSGATVGDVFDFSSIPASSANFGTNGATVYTVKNSTTTDTTINLYSGDTFNDGVSTSYTVVAGGSVEFTSDGTTNWVLISAYTP